MNKYRAKTVKLDGYTFQSKAEMNWYCNAKLRVLAKEINDLRVHSYLPITINGIEVCKVYADIDYLEAGRRVYIDVKGADTNISRLKRKLLHAAYPAIDWRVVYV